MGAVALTAFAAATDTVAAAEQTTIGVLDVNRIIAEAESAKDVNAQIQKLRTEFQGAISKQEKTLRTKEDKLKGQKDKLSKADFDKKIEEFQIEVSELQRSVSGRNNELHTAANASMTKIRDMVVQISEEIAKKQGMKMILPSSFPVYYKDNLDITAQVIKALDIKLPKVKVEVAKATTVAKKLKIGTADTKATAATQATKS